MAKSRKLTISRSERFLEYGGNTTHGTEDDGVELREDDVWSLVDDMVNGSGDHHSMNDDRSSGNIARCRHRTAVVPPPGGLSVAFDDRQGMMVVASPRIVHQFRYSLACPREQHVATSAPVNVPDWSKIYRVDSVESLFNDSDDGTDNQMVPPHEYLARSHQRAAKSVFEGVGRTLKGRDMSRVRDAVWSKTGFNG